VSVLQSWICLGLRTGCGAGRAVLSVTHGQPLRSSARDSKESSFPNSCSKLFHRRNLLSFVAFAALFAAATASLAQLSITSLDRNGTLSWSNRPCTSLPVYEVLHAGPPTGSWEHVAFITNQTSFTLPDFSDGAGAGYYKLAWVSHAPIEFDYVFDEDYGFPAVIGPLSLAFTSGSGLWAFEETEFTARKLDSRRFEAAAREVQ
jgi:hypothetical protein